MKKLIFIGLVFLFSCEKEDYYCWKCETTAKDFQQTTTTCLMTASEAEQFGRGLQIQYMNLTGQPAMTICEKTECLNK